jgi:hypothetical protein
MCSFDPPGTQAGQAEEGAALNGKVSGARGFQTTRLPIVAPNALHPYGKLLGIYSGDLKNPRVQARRFPGYMC